MLLLLSHSPQDLLHQRKWQPLPPYLPPQQAKGTAQEVEENGGGLPNFIHKMESPLSERTFHFSAHSADEDDG